MKKYFVNILILLYCLLSISCSTGKTLKDEAKNHIIAGEVTWEYWKANAGWKIYEAFDYFPNPKDIEKLKSLLKDKDYSYVIFATTFCDDCEHNLPRLFKVFELADIPQSRIRLFGIDERMKEPSGEYQKYDIPNTPVVYLKIGDHVIGEATYPYRWLENFIEILENYK